MQICESYVRMNIDIYNKINDTLNISKNEKKYILKKLYVDILTTFNFV